MKGLSKNLFFYFIITPFIFSCSDTEISSIYITDSNKRVIVDKSANRVHCPLKSDDLLVLFFAGQSNAGNHAERKVNESVTTDVYTFFDGECYRSKSPILGGSGINGDINIYVAKELLKKSKYKKAVIANVSVGSSLIENWVKDKPLNSILTDSLKQLTSHYDVDYFIWIHGESDNRANTPVAIYLESMKSILGSISNFKVKHFAATLNTHCKDYAFGKTNLNKVHTRLMKELDFLEAGNLDILNNSYRIDDCHFNERGQLKAASIISDEIIKTFK